MRGLIEKAKEFNYRYKNEIPYIMKYAQKAKLHRKYDSKEIIMLRLDLIGDCTMFSGAAKAICDYYSDYKITMVCLSICKPIFEKLGTFSKIITLDFRPNSIDYNKLDMLIDELRKEKYDILLQPQVSTFPIADILAASIRANKRIRIKGKPGNSSKGWLTLTSFLYDKKIPYPEGRVSEFDYYGAFVRGVCDKNYRTHCPRINYDNQNFIDDKYYVIYPGGSIRQKFWPAEKYAKLMEYIYERTGYKGVLLGVKSEQWVADDIKNNLTESIKKNVIDLTGETTINDVVDIIGNAKFVVSNDTSGVHIACATQTPSVVIVGGWHYNRFLPYHIEDVQPDDVFPLVANTKMDCYYCDWIWENVEKVNPQCLENLKSEKLSICIEKVSYEQVQELVDQIIEEGNMSL